MKRGREHSHGDTRPFIEDREGFIIKGLLRASSHKGRAFASNERHRASRGEAGVKLDAFVKPTEAHLPSLSARLSGIARFYVALFIASALSTWIVEESSI